jgi:hypothetical protein
MDLPDVKGVEFQNESLPDFAIGGQSTGGMISCGVKSSVREYVSVFYRAISGVV